ncbi:MAG: hypothetical protein IJ996_04435 [Clostridia bacterium]|nr:hypothetical protein [Clostridia bacterium]
MQESAIKPWLYFDVFRVQMFYSSIWSPLAVLLVALEIFVVGLACEIVRKVVLLCLKPLIKKVEQWIENKWKARKQVVVETENVDKPAVDEIDEKMQRVE